MEDEADRVVSVGVPVAVAEVLCGAAVDDEVAGGVFVEAADDVEHGCLAAAGLTEDRDEFALPEREGDSPQRVDDPVPRRVVLDDIPEFKHFNS